MKSLIKSELNRIIRSRKNIVLFILSVALFIGAASYIRIFNVGFYDPKITTELNCLNFAPFILRECHLFLLFVFCLMIFIDSFNNDMTSGVYRLIMIRPYKKRDFILSKIISCAIVTGIFMFLLYVIGTLFGYMFLEKVDYTTFFYIKGNFTPIKALIYNFIFYALEYLIILSALSISLLVSLVTFNSVIAYLVSLALMVGSIYISEAFSFFLTNTISIFDVLSQRNHSFLIVNLLIIIIGVVFSIEFFKKKDYFY